MLPPHLSVKRDSVYYCMHHLTPTYTLWAIIYRPPYIIIHSWSREAIRKGYGVCIFFGLWWAELTGGVGEWDCEIYSPMWVHIIYFGRDVGAHMLPPYVLSHHQPQNTTTPPPFPRPNPFLLLFSFHHYYVVTTTYTWPWAHKMLTKGARGA